MDAAAPSSPIAVPAFSAARTIRVIGLSLALGYLVFLGAAALQGDFMVDRQGRPIANDFVNVVAAGRLARGGLGARFCTSTNYCAAT